MPDDLELPSQMPIHGFQIQVDERLLDIYGGSFFLAPPSDAYFTINLMAEHDLPCTLSLPIKDFGVPSTPDDMVNAFESLLGDHRPVYVGCMAGIGRTGMFMACLLHYLGHPQPIAAVRQVYNPHAVETPEQQAFVAAFPRRADRASTPRSSTPRPS